MRHEHARKSAALALLLILGVTLSMGIVLYRNRAGGDSLFETLGGTQAPSPQTPGINPSSRPTRKGQAAPERLVDTKPLVISASAESVQATPIPDGPPQTEPASDDLPHPHFARCLGDEGVIDALETLMAGSLEGSAPSAKLRFLLDEVDRRGLSSAVPVLLRIFVVCRDQVAKLDVARHLTVLGEFALVPYAKSVFAEHDKSELRHYSTWVLRYTWTIQEMRDIAADSSEMAPIRKLAVSCIEQRLRLDREFGVEIGTAPRETSDERLRGLIKDPTTSMREIALAELYRRSQERK